jgi:plasmid maintenance system antidote protein VapI
MPKQSRQKRQTAEDILRDMFIAQLAVAGLTQQQIREIVGVDMHRVNRIVKHFKKVKQ